LRLKMQAFQARQQALREELDLLIQASLPRQSLLRITAELQRLRSALGLDHAEARLAQLRKQHGRCSGRAGHSFERQALALSREYIVPDLFRRRSTASADRLRILTGVTLGAARTEFDQVLIQQPRGRQCLVDVLAVVEVKRNINDLAHGFRRRQENLAWLTGASAHYDPALYRTGLFRSGHFDREAIHQEGGESYRFDPGSFHRFRRDPAAGMFLDRLYLITQTGMMWGLSSAAMARFRFRVATDEHWEPDLDSCLLPLWRWFQALAEPIETPDLLRIYCLSARRGQQVLVKGPVAANQ
jgi:hypothetical protein